MENLSSSTVVPGTPWTFGGVVPNHVRSDKKARTQWITNPATDWNVYSLFEGINEHIRVTTERPDGQGNPPHKMHGFCADYDHPVTDVDLELALKRFSYSPSFVE